MTPVAVSVFRLDADEMCVLFKVETISQTYHDGVRVEWGLDDWWFAFRVDEDEAWNCRYFALVVKVSL